MRCLIALVSVSTLAAWMPSVGRAHEPHPHPGGGVDQAISADSKLVRGTVFHDRNGNRQHDAGEEGLEGMRVSNGQQIVKTDADGRYELPIDDDQVIFVIKPRNWKTPVNEHQIPQFYYVHKPAGSPASEFPGVAPTGPLPPSVDFPLTKSVEPDSFRAILFGDTQPRNLQEVDYIAHDVVGPIISQNAHDAAFGVTLGDIAFNNLDTMEPLNRSIAMIGIPWYNVIGNHDLNFESPDDEHSDETFERIYGPNYYSFDHGAVHFLVLDDVTWVGKTDDQPRRYFGGLGETQMEFIRNDLAIIPENQMVVLLMHIPLVNVEDRHELYRLIEKRPFSLSFSAHTHYQEHRFIGSEDDWRGPEKHHHVINVTACGSWWRGSPDEQGIPHATMSDGSPNGYSIISFDGAKYSLEFRAARRPGDHQMTISAPDAVAVGETGQTEIVANVFAGSEKSTTEIKVDGGAWSNMQRVPRIDPHFAAAKEGENRLSAQLPKTEKGSSLPWLPLPGAHATPHIWQAKLPADLDEGVHLIQIKTTDMFGQSYTDQRTIRVTPATASSEPASPKPRSPKPRSPEPRSPEPSPQAAASS